MPRWVLNHCDGIFESLSSILLIVVTLCPSYVSSGGGGGVNCRTNENPYCRGVAAFEAICCTYPDVCYWADRAGTPACCPWGTYCGYAASDGDIPDGGGGGGGGKVSTIIVVPAPKPVPTTIYSTVTQKQTHAPCDPCETYNNHPYTTITSIIPQPTTAGNVILVTTTQPGVVEGVTSTIVQGYSSFVQILAGDATRTRISMVGTALLVVGVCFWHLV